jgi:hypothetical protein
MTQTLTLTTAALLTMWTTPTVAPTISGDATYYVDGLMERVAHYRGLSLAGYAGGIALNRAADLGRAAWLRHDGELSGPYRVVDCAQWRHYPVRLEMGYVVEVDYQTAKAWGMVGVGPVPVEVIFDSEELQRDEPEPELQHEPD